MFRDACYALHVRSGSQIPAPFAKFLAFVDVVKIPPDGKFLLICCKPLFFQLMLHPQYYCLSRLAVAIRIFGQFRANGSFLSRNVHSWFFFACFHGFTVPFKTVDASHGSVSHQSIKKISRCLPTTVVLVRSYSLMLQCLDDKKYARAVLGYDFSWSIVIC